MSKRFYIRLFGPFEFGRVGRDKIILSSKQQALIALLATSPTGSRTRPWLQTHLWGNVQAEQAQGSLRTALSTLRSAIGDGHEELLSANREQISLDCSVLVFAGRAEDGAFLEGMDIRYQECFNDWLRERRNDTKLLPEEAWTSPVPTPSAMPPIVPQEGLEILDFDLLPGVVVVPFRGHSNDGQANLFGDVMAEMISRCLSRTRIVSVVSPLSARMLSNEHSLDVTRFRDLHCRFVVTGSINLTASRFEAAVDCHDMSTSRLVSSEIYSGSVADVLNGETDLALTIVRRIVRAGHRAIARVSLEKPLESLELHELLIGAISMMHSERAKVVKKAGEFLNEALSRAPKQPELLAWLGNWHALRVIKSLTPCPTLDIELAEGLIAKSLDHQPDSVTALSFDGMIKCHAQKRLDLAKEQLELALDLEPSHAFSCLVYGVVHAFQGEAETAVTYTERGRRLSPFDPQKYHYDSLTATAHLSAKNFSRALELSRASLRQNAKHPSTLRVQTIALQNLGREEEARRSAFELMHADPKFRVETYLANHPAAEFETGRSWADALRAAGIPD